jgi:hypothetical protein
MPGPLILPGGLDYQVLAKVPGETNQIDWMHLTDHPLLDAILDQDDNATLVGAVNATTGLACSIVRTGNIFQLTFTLTAMSITVTDAAGSGSSGSSKLFDLVSGAFVPLACTQNYTAFAEGAALTGGAGDAAFIMALGSAAANAGDAALTGTEVDIGSATATITLSGGTGTGKKANGALAVIGEPAGTAVDIYLNWSGSATTIDANSTIAVTGVIKVVGVLLT